jgi:hypothetical protein
MLRPAAVAAQQAPPELGGAADRKPAGKLRLRLPRFLLSLLRLKMIKEEENNLTVLGWPVPMLQKDRQGQPRRHRR